ncbi:MAG: YceI family protein [Acidimicrobiales bacterium]
MTSTTSTTSHPTREFEGLALPEAGIFAIDTTHSEVGFLARHMVVTKVRGRFGEYSGQVVLAENPLDSTVEVTIRTSSIDTREEARDNHLRSGDFFESEAHPELTFKSTAVEHRGGARFSVTGDLAIKEVTKPVTLDVDYGGVIVDPYGGERIGFTARTEIDRYDFGLTWGTALETGGLVVGRNVLLELEVEAVRTA